MNAFDRFENRTMFSAILRMETALSVGSRTSLEPTGSDLPVIKGADGLPFIPGSSLKGAVRSQMERVLRSFNRHEIRACDPFGDPCVSSNAKTSLMQTYVQDEQAFSQQIWEASCTVCRLFGSPWFASRLAFKDAVLHNAEDLPVLTQIRDGVGIDRDLGAARDGIKYDFEVVVPGAQFDIEILAENVQTWEMGLFLAILRPWQEGHLPIGGKSTRGPGWGRLENLAIHRVEQPGLPGYLLRGEMKSVTPDAFLKAFQDKIGG